MKAQLRDGHSSHRAGHNVASASEEQTENQDQKSIPRHNQRKLLNRLEIAECKMECRGCVELQMVNMVTSCDGI